MSEKKVETQAPKIGPMVMGGGQHGLRGAVEKPKDFWNTLKRLVRYLKPQLPKIIFVIILAVASTVFTVYGPRISGMQLKKYKRLFKTL